MINISGEWFARRLFAQSGFAVSVGRHKVGPCPLGSFVDGSRTDRSCKNCPAGKL